MPSHDETPSPRAAAPSRPPSLLGAPASGAAPGVRMLDAIGGAARPESPRASRGRWAWLAGSLLLAGVAAIALLGRREPAPVVQAVTPVLAAAASASSPASAAVAEPASTARIEAPAEVPPAASAAAPVVAPIVVAAPASAARPAVRTARPAPAASAPRTRVAAQQKADPLGAPASRVPREGAGRDADVDLIAALLARMGHAPAPATGAAALDAPTIAQLVQRCEANPPAEARSCRLRICDGYWGKADACPMRLAPAKKG